MTTLYTKQGRRYVVWGHAEQYDQDLLRAGQWRMAYCPADGERRFRYDVLPDTASFIAACELAQHGMEQAIQQRAIARPSGTGFLPYSKRQREIIERFRADMAAAGGLVPAYWHHATAREIAQAGVEAVRKFSEAS